MKSLNPTKISFRLTSRVGEVHPEMASLKSLTSNYSYVTDGCGISAAHNPCELVPL